MNSVFTAFLLTLIAGLATGIGSFIAFFAKKTNTRFLCLSLGFSAGVMIYVSMIEIFQQANKSLVLALGEKIGSIVNVIAFFCGIFIIAIIDKLVPSEENPHEIKKIEDINEDKINKNKSLLRTGVFTAIAITIHNFPEGLATFVSALNDVSLAIPITIAIAIHNIPEGISVSVPIYYATGDKKKAFLYSFLSGMSEPLGAIIGYTLLRNIINDITLGILLSSVAGIMVFISLDELLPTARKYGEHHISIYGLIAGMAVMAISLIMFI
ncbi:zinc transporter ZupT [Clostridium sp.]|uniref:zinc transporter ZupT n=1 Tax=Clostridium sp. TaxID=1506 RepID=UPI0026DCF5CF|nr:zinc transporter ZupT [Clostridium sp.]MDO5039389.1 zinc transporter ZupT [Clostridium sp.]